MSVWLSGKLLLVMCVSDEALGSNLSSTIKFCLFFEILGIPWKHLKFLGIPWKHLEFFGISRKHLETIGIPRNSKDSLGFLGIPKFPNVSKEFQLERVGDRKVLT